MAPGVLGLECEATAEAAIEPQLHRMITRITSRLVSGDVANASEHPIVGNQLSIILRRYSQCRSRNLKSRIPIAAVAGAAAASLVGRDVVMVHIAPPDMQAMVTDIRSIQSCVFQKLMRNGQVPLVALGWPEVRIDGIETGIRVRPGNVGREARIDRVETATGRTGSESVVCAA